MLEWIPAFFEKSTAFVPRFAKVPPTERLVKWSRCQEATLHGPGIIWHWPLITEVEHVDVRWRSCLMHVQSTTMADGTSVSARALTRWRTRDVLQCIVENEDVADLVAELSQTCVVDVLAPLSRLQLQSVTALNAALTMENRVQLGECGVEVQLCKFTELVVSPAFRIINDSA